MNYKVILRSLGLVFLSFGFCFALSLLVGIYVDTPGEQPFIEPWLYVINFNWLIGLICCFFSKNASRWIFRKEGVVIVGFSWILAIFISMVPFYVLLENFDFVDCLFEASSGLTTTGFSVVNDFSLWPYSLIFWRSFTQWIGGMGVLIIFVGFFSFLGMGSRMIYEHESSGRSNQIDSSLMKSGILKVFILYAILSVFNILLYYWGGLSFFESICLMCSTLPTGGFSVGGKDFIEWNNLYIEAVAITFMLIGGSSFCLLYQGIRKLLANIEVKMYIAFLLITVSAVILCLAFTGYMCFIYLGHALFQTVSFLTTTGFSSCDYTLWPLSAQFILLIAMGMGACSGSTAGGFRMFRVFIIFQGIKINLEKVFRPNLIKPLRLGEEVIPDEIHIRALQYIILWLFCFSIGVVWILAFDSHLSLMTVLSCVVSSLSNAGCAMDQLGPLCNASILSPFSKCGISILMLIGRLEFFGVFSLLYLALKEKL